MEGMILGSFLTRLILCASTGIPIRTAAVYNGVDMVLCGLAYKYFQSKATGQKDKDTQELTSVFYSRSIGCMSGIVATHFLCQNRISSLFAVGVNTAACLACFIAAMFSGPNHSIDRKKERENHLWV